MTSKSYISKHFILIKFFNKMYDNKIKISDIYICIYFVKMMMYIYIYDIS